MPPHLREAVGGMEGPQRWREFLDLGSRTAREFGAGWEAMTAEATATWRRSPSGALSAKLEEVGGSSVDGSTRTKLVQQREGMRHKLLTAALKSVK